MTNLIPFNLERALAGDPLITRDGKPARIVYKSEIDKDYPLLIVTGENGEDEGANWFTSQGKFMIGKDEDEYDLFMAPKIKKYYVHIYKNDNGEFFAGCIYEYNESKNKTVPNYHTTLEFEIEE